MVAHIDTASDWQPKPDEQDSPDALERSHVQYTAAMAHVLFP